MATASLLKLTPYNLKQSTYYFLIQSPRNNNCLLPCFIKKQASNFAISCSSQNHPKFTPIKCCFTQIQPSSSPIENDAPDNKIVHTILILIKSLQKQVVAAILMAVLLLMYNPYSSAMAASGGRMGGRSRSFSRSSSHSSRSYTTRSRLSSSRSYTTRSRLSSSRNLNKKKILIEELHTIMSPGSGFSYSVVPPFSGGGGGGVNWGPAIGLSLSITLIMGLVVFVLVRWIFSDESDVDGLLTASVVKLQVGLSGFGGRTLQGDLNRIAETADTSTPTGLSYVLTKTTLALLQHPDYCISGYSSVDIKRGMEDVERHFDQLSIDERRKFDEETLVNVNNIKRRKITARSQRGSEFSKDYIVITILVAAEGIHELPAINGSGDLKEALQKFLSLPSSRILAVEVLWTPQEENDILSEREFREDYPLLRPL